MTKGELIALIQSQVAAGETTATIYKKMHYNEVSKLISLVFDTLIWQAYEKYSEKRDPSVFDNYILSYPNPYTNENPVPVLKEPKTGRYYSILPVPPLPMPKNMAIRHIGPTADEGTGFQYRNVSSTRIFSGLEIDSISDVIEYSVEGMTVYYHRFDDNIREVSMKLLPHFSDIDDDQQIFLPMGTSTILFQAVTDALTGRMQIPEPTVNNQNSKQR